MSLTPESFVLKRRKSLPRNKVILETLYLCKNAEMFGSGFKKAYNFCEKEGVKVKYDLDPYGFPFFFLRNSDDIQSKRQSSQENDWMNDIDRSVLSLIRETGAVIQGNGRRTQPHFMHHPAKSFFTRREWKD